jgi:putative spermidine/putrescine transport system permease protein
VPASPSSLSVVTDVVQAVDEPGAELSAADSVGLLSALHNYWVVLFSLTLTGFPFAFLLTPSYLSGIDPSLERAAATLGASPRQRFWHVTVPLLAPGLATTLVLAFSVSTRVISTATYDGAFQEYDYSMGSAIELVMGVVELAVIALVLFMRARLYRGPSAGGRG